MMEEFGLTQEDVASKVGKSRSSIANIVRLLNLSPKVQVYVSRETLSMGHARALLAIKNPEEQIQVADYIIKNNLSVRETEKFVHSFNKEMEKKKEKAVTQNKKTVLGPEWIKAQEELSRLLGTKVKIKNNNNKKVITIECDNYSDVKKLINTLSLG